MKANHIELNVKVAGQGKPFIWGHGLMGSMALEDTVGWFGWDAFGDPIQLIRYDARGHGRSEATRSPEDYRWSNLAQDMIGLAEELETGPFIAGGQSMGCATSIYAGLQAPQLVKALVLVNPPIAWETRAKQASLYDRFSLAVRLLGPGLLGKLLSRNPERLLPAWIVAAAGDQMNNYTGMVGQMDRQALATILKGAALCDLPPREDLGKLEVPALILAWEGDRTHPVESAVAIHDRLPQSELVITVDMEDFLTWPERIKSFVISRS
jgi:pimeloyl-ACP methyl ester carboxylesterase